MSLKDFVIMEKLGSGSFASVYKARRLIDQKIYALKKIDMKALGIKQKNNALNQVRLLACLNSPFIIGYCQSFFQQKLDLLCIAMQYAEGGDLLKYIQNCKKKRTLITEIQIWKILLHLLYGLNELHIKNILHRDLKSQNIFIATGNYKIGDMNVSKIIKNGLAKTQTGTPFYASPEVWKDQSYNQKSDIWSLGCILFEVAALNPPFQASNMQKLFDNVTKAPTPKIPKNYSRQLQQIIQKCLQKNPTLRPTTKQLLQHPTVKLYENLLIQFKPQVDQNRKNELLKTIYMPSSKKQLKNQLPQSNYKRIQNKELLNDNNQIKYLIKQQKDESLSQEIKQNRELMKVQQIKQCLQKPQQTSKNTLQQGKQSSKVLKELNIPQSSKKSTQKKRERILSCQLSKPNNINKNKYLSDSNNKRNKQNLVARAEFIIESQGQNAKNKKRPEDFSKNKSKQKRNSSQNSKYQVKDSAKKQDNNIKKLLKQVQELQPKKLMFEQAIQQKFQQQNLYQSQTKKETDELQRSKNQMAQIKKEKIQQKQKEQVKQVLNLSKKSIIIEQINPVSLQSSLPLDQKDHVLQIFNSPLKNYSQCISQRDHLQYNFGIKQTNKKEEKYLQKQEQKLQARSIEQTKQQNSPIQRKTTNYIQIKKIQENQIYNQLTKYIQQKDVLKLEEQLKLTNMNIKVDINQNYQTQILKNIDQISFSKNSNFRIGIQKINSFKQKKQLKNKLVAWNSLKTQYQLKIMKIKQEQYLFKAYNQSKIFIKECLQNKIFEKNSIQVTPTKNSIELKRNRSKSMPKTERPKNSNVTSKIQVLQIKNKIQAAKINQQNDEIKNISCSEKKQIRKESSRKKIFMMENNNKDNKEHIRNLYQNLEIMNKKLKQMALPSYGGKNQIVKQNICPSKIPYKQNMNHRTQQKNRQKRPVLTYIDNNCNDVQENIIQYQNGNKIKISNEREKQRYLSKMDLNIKVSLKQTDLQNKKRKIFRQDNKHQLCLNSQNKNLKENRNRKELFGKGNNVIEQITKKLDRIDLQNKIKRYINV